MDHPILQKTIVLFILALWVIDPFRTKSRKHTESTIEEADARERHKWRYLRWGVRTIQIAATVYMFAMLIQFLLK
ncbi:TPA: hypothetical protein ACM7BV_003154 [Escherichia coli]